MADTVVTPVARASYAYVFQAHKMPGDDDAEPKFSITLIIPKEEKEALAKLKKACMAVAVDKFGEATVKSKKFKWPFKDGDQEDDAVYEGCIFIRAASKRKPQVVDSGLDPIMDQDDFYSGCYCRASLRPFTYDHPTGGKGVSFGLQNVMKVKDGEALAGGSKAEDDFAEFADPASASSAGDENIDDII